jgi:hypothetical protein
LTSKGGYVSYFFSFDDLKSIGRLSCVSAIFGILQSLILTFFAILFYPGGYNFFMYFLSDLGTVRARNGDLNPVSSFLFSIAFSILALSLIPFWLIIRTLFTETIFEKVLSALGSVMGLISTLIVVGVVLYPMDTQFDVHEFLALSYSFSLALAIFFYSVAIILNQDYPNYIAIVSFILFIVIGFFSIVGFGEFQAFVQKVIFSGFIIWVLTQIIRVWPLVGLENTVLV